MFGISGRLQTGLKLVTRTPLHLSLFAIVSSNIITAIMVVVTIGPDLSSITTGAVIATACSGPLSYITGHYVFAVRDRLADQNKELMIMNRELDTFAHTVAHDLKNPISNIIGYADYILESTDDIEPAEFRKQVERIRIGGRRTIAIIEELLILSQIRNHDIHMDVVDVKQTVKTAQSRLHHVIERYKAVIHIDDDFPAALGYAPWIEEIWANYLSNSIKYGGHPPLIHIGSSADPNGMVRYWIRDNGPGIVLEKQQQLFAEFERLEEHMSMVEGSGLGLSIVQRIASKLGGEVGVESIVGQGSTFYFTLPRADS